MPKDYAGQEPTKWVTIRGHRVPIYEGDSEKDVADRFKKSLNRNTGATVKTQAEHAKAVKELSSNSYEDGTQQNLTRDSK